MTIFISMWHFNVSMLFVVQSFKFHFDCPNWGHGHSPLGSHCCFNSTCWWVNMARNAQEKAKQEAEGTELYGHQSSTCRILSYKRAIFHIFFFLGVLQIILKGLLICWLFGVGWREYSLISNRLSMIIWLWNCPQAWWFIYVRIVPTPSDVHKTQYYVTMSRVLVDILGALGHYGGEFTASSSCEIMQIGVDIGAKCKMHS